jgi:hypothetical protein
VHGCVAIRNHGTGRVTGKSSAAGDPCVPYRVTPVQPVTLTRPFRPASRVVSAGPRARPRREHLRRTSGPRVSSRFPVEGCLPMAGGTILPRTAPENPEGAGAVRDRKSWEQWCTSLGVGIAIEGGSRQCNTRRAGEHVARGRQDWLKSTRKQRNLGCLGCQLRAVPRPQDRRGGPGASGRERSGRPRRAEPARPARVRVPDLGGVRFGSRQGARLPDRGVHRTPAANTCAA